MKLGNLKNEATEFLGHYKSENPATYAAAQQAIGGLLILDGFIGIDNPMGGKKRPGIFGSLSGIAVGIIFMFIPMIFGNLSGINKMTATTNATIVSINRQQSTSTDSDGTQHTGTSCTALARYTVNGKQYTQDSSMGSSGMCSLAPGQTTQIYYNPDNPGQWATDVKTLGMVFKLFFFVGVAAAIVSAATFVIRLLSIIFGWKLLKSGRALAKTLPGGTDLSSVIKQVEQTFKSSLFGFGGNASPVVPQPAPASVQPVATPQATVTPTPQTAPQPEPTITPQDNNQPPQ